jgi:hypothetical protein
VQNYRYRNYLTAMVELRYSIQYMRISAQRLSTHGWQLRSNVCQEDLQRSHMIHVSEKQQALRPHTQTWVCVDCGTEGLEAQ